MSSTKFAYRHLPVSGRYGEGVYTYTFIIRNNAKVKRFEIFADSIEIALNYVPYILNMPIVDWRMRGDSTWQIFPYDARGCEYFVYLD